MQDKGMAGGLDVNFPKPTRDGFAANQRKLLFHVQNLEACKQSLTEMKAASKQNTAAYAEKEKQKGFEQSQITNLKGILLRAQSTGIWTEPSKPYLSKLAGRRELQNRLVMLGQHDVVVDREPVMTLRDLLS
eukprot:TRINITY_DN22364_c0_g1_i2.p1 TRINITY_DN22364_c0_g1~~TRINITY_DN22364_c0_g1_i2.p1  ORF type:complete len:132 (-),score=32.10 TRINITY_DN22364_c0_g1_i2:536-931(-)